MKIVFIYGVGYHEDVSTYEIFLSNIKKQVKRKDVETSIHIWSHDWSLPVSSKSSFKAIKNFFSEVVLDFQYAIKYAETMDIPEADLYIGHSAGSIIALSQNKPCILMGSPVALVKEIVEHPGDAEVGVIEKVFKNCCKILNIVNKYDIVSYEVMDNKVQNDVYSGPCYNPLTYLPITAHSDYFKSKIVVKKIAKFIEAL